MSGKRISQATFDEVVQECIDDFGMSKDEALKDAISQFVSQGVDLQSIDVTGGIGVEELELHWESIHKPVFEASTLVSFEALIALCGPNGQYATRNQNLFRSRGWFNQLHIMIDKQTPPEQLVPTMQLFQVLSKTNAENRDFFEPHGSRKLNEIIRYYLTETNDTLNSTLLTAAFSLAATMSRSENNKLMLFRLGMKDLLLKAIALDCDATATEERVALVTAACSAMKTLSTHDDPRSEMSCAMDNGKYFMNGGCVPLLLTIARSFKTRPAAAAAAMSACRAMILTEEAVQVVAQHGGLELPVQILSWNEADTGLIRSILGLIRNLSADDNRKNKLMGDGTMERMVAVMSTDKCLEDAVLEEHGIAGLAAMSLRFPGNSVKIFKSGALEIVAKAMQKHMDRAALIRQGCLLIRNIAGRCPELRTEILDVGVERVLRRAGLDPMCAPEAYAALRDLGCDVQYVKVLEDGQIVPAVEMFGEAKNLKFNPVYDDRDDFNQRVDENASAPFKGQQEIIDHDHDHQHTEHCSH